ncbi:YokU family protein [Bacillus massilinigeriensis]|uniref:YokU family protein n=1 Tax=Bacillus mediterraneensis TaxID=1805474 RepID=UPI0008F8D44E|nr:YokU family protein [Bacillus mediterraneensis]
MSHICEWCGRKADETRNTVFWELPDGSRAIAINETPAITCSDCGMTYQTEEIIKEIEDQLFLVDTSKIDKVIKFEDLMAIPRLLKRNYFDFSS